MDGNQPRKRGRKKKTAQEEAEPIAIPAEKQEHVSTEEPVIENTAPKSKLTKEQVTEKLELAAREFDEISKPENLVDYIHSRIMKTVLGSNEKREEGFDEEYNCIYNKIKDNNVDREEETKWREQITYGMVIRITRMIDFLLQSGPLTSIEHNVLENCTESLRSYYLERYYLIQNESSIYLKHTYFPEEGSCIYRYITEVVDIPCFKKVLMLQKSNR